MNYVVFPGNVGDEDALLRVAITLGVMKKIKTIKTESNHEENQSKKQRWKKIPMAANPDRPTRNIILTAFSNAQSNGCAIAAFNVYNLEGAKAVVAAAEVLNTPIILQVHPSSFKFGGKPFLDLLCSFRKNAAVPVFVHIDHAEVKDERAVLDMLDYINDINSVMIDGSALDLEENIKWTAKMASYAHEAGAIVEAELGRLTGEEDGLSVPEKDAKMTDPSIVARFVKETNVDMLAVTIGNVHGNYSFPPQLDFLRLDAIRNNLPQGFPLVLHGASGLSKELIVGAISRGVCKFNVNTDLRAAAVRVIKDTMERSNKVIIVIIISFILIIHITFIIFMATIFYHH
jgi:tagatose 1,6-diphosphate aldolase GatY/KbaY